MQSSTIVGALRTPFTTTCRAKVAGTPHCRRNVCAEGGLPVSSPPTNSGTNGSRASAFPTGLPFNGTTYFLQKYTSVSTAEPKRSNPGASSGTHTTNASSRLSQSLRCSSNWRLKAPYNPPYSRSILRLVNPKPATNWGIVSSNSGAPSQSPLTSSNADAGSALPKYSRTSWEPTLPLRSSTCLDPPLYLV